MAQASKLVDIVFSDRLTLNLCDGSLPLTCSQQSRQISSVGSASTRAIVTSSQPAPRRLRAKPKGHLHGSS